MAPAPRPVTRDAQRALAPAARARRARVVITRVSLRGAGRPHRFTGDRKRGAVRRAQRVARIDSSADTARNDPRMSVGRAILTL
ncbi:MAG: hypothetical protein EPN51_09075 [Mycobacterium sp.]|nr:MAG: hypothetical protein EPN51_09075 [Mycobacterium sp.]